MRELLDLSFDGLGSRNPLQVEGSAYARAWAALNRFPWIEELIRKDASAVRRSARGLEQRPVFEPLAVRVRGGMRFASEDSGRVARRDRRFA